MMHSRAELIKQGPRRVCATFLLVLFAALLIVPGIQASRSGDDVSLPACCRAHGKHHCSMGGQASAEESGRPAFAQVTEKCPYSPVAPAATHGNGFDIAVADLIFAEVISSPAVRSQTEAKRRTSLDRSNQKRGPPTVLLPA